VPIGYILLIGFNGLVKLLLGLGANTAKKNTGTSLVPVFFSRDGI